MAPLDILIAWLVTFSSLILISQLPLGVDIDNPAKGLISAAVLGMLNVLVLPILKALFFIPNVLTLGLLSGVFALVMNVAIFYFAAQLVRGFRLRMGIWSAVFGAIALALVSNFIETVLI
jgi:putative membrane protein